MDLIKDHEWEVNEDTEGRIWHTYAEESNIENDYTVFIKENGATDDWYEDVAVECVDENIHNHKRPLHMPKVEIYKWHVENGIRVYHLWAEYDG